MPPRKPDHTGVLISPLSAFLVSAIVAAMLISRAAQFARGDMTPGRYLGVTRKGIGAFLEWLAQTLGVGGSVGLSAVLVLGSGAWLFVAVRRYRVLVASSK